jgi:hypothetical protein
MQAPGFYIPPGSPPNFEASVKIPLRAKRALRKSRRGEVEVGGQSPQAGTYPWRDSRRRMSAVSGASVIVTLVRRSRLVQ